MSANYRYEAWRNFLLILAGILVADALANFGTIRKSLLSFVDFDKTMTTHFWPEALATLVVFYVVKNAHGVLITLFDEEYFDHVKNSRAHVMISCALTGLVIVSFSVITRLGSLIENGYDVRSRGWRLMLLTLCPTLILLAFDGFHIKIWGYARGSLRVRSFVREILLEIFKNPLERKSHPEYKRIWIAEGIFSITALLIWFAVINFIVVTQKAVLFTLSTIAAILFINSVADYFLNFNYFFFVDNKVAGAPLNKGASIPVSRPSPSQEQTTLEPALSASQSTASAQ